MKILILGGSGILSTDFTKLCTDQGNDVYMVNRGKRKGLIDERANLIIADLRSEDIDSLRSKIANIKYDVVVDFLSYNPEQMKKTVEVIKDAFTQYVFISSATAYIKKYQDEIISESNSVGNKDWDYAYQKSLCERYLKQQNFNYTIIRPYVTFGLSRMPFPIIPDNYYYTVIERIKENKPIIMLDHGKAICTLTCTKDFAQVLYRLLLNTKAYKEAFHITSNNRQTWKEVYLTICEILNKSSITCSVSIEDINKYMPEFEFILKGDKGQNMLFDNSKVLAAIDGYNFQYSLMDALKESIEYFESHPQMQGIDFKFDGRCDYLIKKKFKCNLSSLVLENEYSNNRKYYIMMTNPILRSSYETARKAKHIIKKVWGRD